MRKWLVAAATIALSAPAMASDEIIAAAPLPAATLPTVMGYMGIYGGVTIGPGISLPTATINGAAVLPLGNLNVELEARSLSVFFTPGIVQLSAGLVHAYWRNDRAAVGTYGGLEFLTTGVAIWHVGGEAQLYFDTLALFAQAAYLHIVPGNPGNWYARGGIRFFPAENFRIEASVRLLHITGLSNAYSVTGEAEYQLRSSPLSLVATLRYGATAGTQNLIASGGLRFNFGGGRLSDQVAPMDTLALTF